MSFYVVPSRKVSALQNQLVTSLNGLTGGVTLVGDGGIIITSDPVLAEITASFDSSAFVLSTGGTMTGNLNLDLTSGANKYGLGLYAAGGADPTTSRTGAVYYNTDLNTARIYDGSAWGDLGSGGGAGSVTSVTAGTGLAADGVPGASITSTGTLTVNQAGNFTWSGNHVFQTAVVFQLANTFAAAQTFNGANLTFSSQPLGSIIYRGVSNWTTLTPGTNGQVLSLASSIPSWVDTSSFASLNQPKWVKTTIGYASAVLLGGVNGNIDLTLLPPGAVVQGVKIKHSVAFAGSGITFVDISVGTASNPTKHLPAFTVTSSVTSTNMGVSMSTSVEDHVSSTQMIARFISNAPLSSLTAGSVDVWVLYSLAV